MAVEVTIKSKSLFKKKLSFNDILLDDMRFGIMDEAFRLDEGKIGDYTVVFSSKNICRGYEVSLNNGCINLRMPLPTSRYDIEYFYEYVKILCGKMGVKKFKRDEEEISFDLIEKCIDLDITTCNSALKKMSEGISSGEYSIQYTFGAVCPIALGEKEFGVINGDCEKFGELLNKLQSMDVYYASGRVYQKDNEDYFGVFVLTSGVDSVFPLKPKILMSDNKIEIKEWYVGFVIDGEMKGFIPYDKLIESIKTDNIFDSEHFIITMDDKKMKNLLSKHKVDL